MDSELFSTEIKDRFIGLETAADIVRFSFIVQHSISYLDLQLCRNSPISDYYFGRVCACCARSHFRSCLNTVERCRKFFTPGRRLLYTLHLDLPEGRELSLKDVREFGGCSRDSNSRHVAEIGTICGFRGEMLSNLIEDAFDRNVPKKKILKMVTDTPSSDLPLLCQLPIETANEFLECFYPEIPSSKLFKDFIRHLDIVEWAETFECIEQLEYLLYCARRHGNVLLEGSEFELVSQCLHEGEFRGMGPILKYVHAACLVKEDYEYYLSEIKRRRPRMTATLVKDVEQWMGTERVHRVLQVDCIYLENFLDGTLGMAAEALCLVWNSIPDPYITYGELAKGFGEALGEVDLEVLHEFYSEAVGEPCEHLEPRSLKHLCRTVLRSTFWDNKLWIPEGIKRLPLPKSLQLYLNLDQSLSIPGTALSS